MTMSVAGTKNEQARILAICWTVLTAERLSRCHDWHPHGIRIPVTAVVDAKLKRLYDAIENGVADLTDPMLKDRVAELKAVRDQARADAERAKGALDRLGPSITPQALKTFARQARKRIRTESGGYRRDHLRALAQRVEVDAKEVRIMGSKSVLPRTLVAASSAKTAGFGVPSFVPKWRPQRDSNPRRRRERAVSA
jgi:site-specific DNA recombinase